MPTHRRTNSETRTCLHCGGSFAPWRPSQPTRFCSQKCFQANRAAQAGTRFWSFVERRGDDECWPWTGAIKPNGYGNWRPSTGRSEGAHRAAFRLFAGKEIPPGAHVCHSCDNRKCCNPRHLWLGSHADNMADMTAKGRSAKGRLMPQGEMSPRAKLTAEQVKEIKRDGEPASQVAKRLGVHRNNIYHIRSGKTWRHL